VRGAGAGVPKSLDRARALVEPVLRAAAATLSPGLRRIAEYHFGWRDESGQPFAASGGKMLRPTLAILAAEAVGGPAECAVAGAAALQIVHDFTLLHDDVMDEDATRRHRPTAWTVFGVGNAICAGDALVLLAHRLLLEDPGPHRVAALRCLLEATETVIAGQTLDLAYEGDTSISVDDYLRMAGQKTSALLGGSAAIGAILAGADAGRIAALRDFGVSLGNAFQGVDDWLGIWGASERTGKPVASDLRRRKASLPIVLAMRSGTDAGDDLAAWMRRTEPVDDRAVARAMEWLAAVGVEPQLRARVQRELDHAREALACVDPPAGVRAELLELARFVGEREF